MHKLAEAYHQRPSFLIGITDDWLAWEFDHAVLTYGRYVDNKLDERKVKNKKTGETERKWTLEEILTGKANQPKGMSMTDIFLASGADRMVLQ